MSKLLDNVRENIRVRHYSIRTEEAYVGWIKEYIRYFNKRHPAELGSDEIRAFLSYLAVKRNVASSTQNEALSALLFLYREVLDRQIDWIDDITRANGRRDFRWSLPYARFESRRSRRSKSARPLITG